MKTRVPRRHHRQPEPEPDLVIKEDVLDGGSQEQAESPEDAVLTSIQVKEEMAGRVNYREAGGDKENNEDR